MKTLAALPLALLALSFHPQERCALTIELVDASTGAPLWGIVRVETAKGEPVRLEGLLSRGLGIAAKEPITKWSVLPERATVFLPREALRIEALHGLDRKLAKLDVDLAGKAAEKATLRLERFYDAAKTGYRNANTHLHLMKIPREEADRYLREVPRADGLELVFLSYLERADDDTTYISNRYTDQDLVELSKTGVLFGNGEEHRHNFKPYEEGYGHVMFLEIKKLIQPVSIGPGITKAGTDAPPLQPGIDEARRQGATVVWCHNTFGLEDIPNLVTGRLHAMNIFDGGTHGSFRHTFYRYLNAALKVPFSTGTDWFIYDYSRVYARMPAITRPSDFLENLKAGRTYITNGPFLEFKVNGKEAGETARLKNGARVHATGRVVGRVDFRRVELVRNGAVVRWTASSPKEGVFEAAIDDMVDVTEPCWFALRIPPPPVKDDPEFQEAVPLNELGQPLFGHTSAVYVEIDGLTPARAKAVKELLEEVERNKAKLLESAVFKDDAERAQVLKVYDDGAAALRKLLGE
jgi:hypothetical protein